jgi:hypothetical protein
MPSRSRGQAIIEYLAYIALAMLVLAGLALWITRGRHNTVVQNESNAFNAMLQGTQKLYSSDPNGFANVTAQALIDNGVVDPKMVIGGQITSGFGSPVGVAPANLYGTGDGVAFTYLVPADECSEFATSTVQGLAKLVVGGTTVVDSTVGTALAPATLGTACKSSGGGNVSMVLTASR